jgi:hypothetical protein
MNNSEEINIIDESDQNFHSSNRQIFLRFLIRVRTKAQKVFKYEA